MGGKVITGSAIRVVIRAGFVAVIGAMAACASGPELDGGQRRAQPGAEQRPIVAGGESTGPFIQGSRLSDAASSGDLVWLADDSDSSRLMGIDGDTGEVVVDHNLEIAVNWPDGLIDGGEELWAIGSGRVLRIDTETGAARSAAIEGNPRAFGHITRQDNRLVAADPERGIVAIDPSNGSTRLLAPATVPWLVAIGPDETYWVVEDANRKQLLRVNSQGNHVVENHREDEVVALVADDDGHLWFSQQTAPARAAVVSVVNSAGETISEVNGFTNVRELLNCDGAVVASDFDTGELAWLDAAGRNQRVRTGGSGRAIACAPGGVWFVTADGYLARVREPSG
jgi:hypothetical protein